MVLVVVGVDPRFDVLSINVTVIRGQTATLKCSIEFLGKYKVSDRSRPSDVITVFTFAPNTAHVPTFPISSQYSLY